MKARAWQAAVRDVSLARETKLCGCRRQDSNGQLCGQPGRA